MFVLAGTIVTALLLVGTLVLLERSRSRAAAAAADAVLGRARRRVASHSAALGEVARAADRVYGTERITPDHPRQPSSSKTPSS